MKTLSRPAGVACTAALLAGLAPQPLLAAATSSVAFVKALPPTYVSDGLVADSAGNLYGSFAIGGANGRGLAYEVSPPRAGKNNWVFRKLLDYGQTVDTDEGNFAVDGAGNLYGVSYYGGKYSGGTLFELVRPASSGGKWAFKLLHSFGSSTDGFYPFAGVTIGPDGAIYGTTTKDSVLGFGAAYALLPPDAHGARAYKVLHLFQSQADGSVPQGGVLIDAAGNLFSTAFGGFGPGAPNGEVFELSPPSGGAGAWTFTTLYTFAGGADGSGPIGVLTADKAGHIFGTTKSGGAGNGGTVYELSPPAKGSTSWTEQVIANFVPAGFRPVTGVELDATGRLFGTTAAGSVSQKACSGGSVFRLTPPSPGQTAWQEDILDTFGSSQARGLGCMPAAGLTPLSQGKFFGLNAFRNPANPQGTIFSVTP